MVAILIVTHYQREAIMTEVSRLLAAGLLVVALTACGSTVATTPGAVAAGGARPVDNGLGAPAPVTSGPPGVAIAPGAVPDPGGGTSAGTAGAAPTRTLLGGGTSTGTSGTSAGTAANRSPIKIGIIYVNNDSGASSAGINNGNTFTPRRAYEALVAAYNARGGLAGRHINPVYVELKSSSTTLKADIEAGCNTFTQDQHVAAVLGGTGIYSEDLSGCLAKARTPQISGDYALGDTDSLKRAPYLLQAVTLTVDDRVGLMLERLTTAGRLTAKDKLGIVVEGCPFDQRAYTRTVQPIAKRLGLTIAQKVEARCFGDIRDLGGQASDMQSAVLKFQTNGVNKVVFVSGSVESNMLLYFATAAESQSYHPGYALTSAAAAALQEANTPKAQLANAVGLGWMPSLDSSHVPPLLPAGRRCLQDLQKAAGLTPQSPADRVYAFGACDTVGLYDAALRATHGDPNVSGVLASVAALRTGFAGATSYGERTDFSAGRRTGPAQGRIFAWSTGCTCFDYTGSPVSLTNG
jgi:hypothetical protein